MRVKLDWRNEQLQPSLRGIRLRECRPRFVRGLPGDRQRSCGLVSINKFQASLSGELRNPSLCCDVFERSTLGDPSMDAKKSASHKPEASSSRRLSMYQVEKNATEFYAQLGVFGAALAVAVPVISTSELLSFS